MKDIINARCGWAGTDELYIKYHDEEWGRPVSDDKTLFNFWCWRAPRRDYPGLLSSGSAKDTGEPSMALMWRKWRG